MARTKNSKNSILCGSPNTFISTTAAGLGDPRHFPDALRHVGKQHHAELRSGHVEAVVIEFERVAVHNAGLDVEPLVACPRAQPFEHDGRLVGRQYLRAEAQPGY